MTLRKPFHVGFKLAYLLAGCGSLVLAEVHATEPIRETTKVATVVLSELDQVLLDQIERNAFQYFVEQSHPRTGLVRDRARADGSTSEGKASIAASGFALSSWAIATERGWTERKTAVEHCRTLLHFLAEEAPRRHGFFYHFMEMDTGARAWQCELSTIDTGLLLAGAIMAREYFQDDEITKLVNQLYREVDWEWFLNGGQTFSMGWHDESGFSRFRWSKYSELMMLTLLGIGAGDNPIVPEVWNAWERKPDDDYAGYHYIQGAPLFVHQFTQAYINFRGLRDAHADYFQNSVIATLAQRQFCIDLQSEFPLWNETMWGLTASDSATGYKAWGGPPRTTGDNAIDGSIVPCAAAGSVPFAPAETMAVLHNLRNTYGDKIWKRYGFVDAFNPHTGWFDADVIGIDIGISMLQAENARSGLIWSVFNQAPEIKRALIRAGFISKDRELPPANRERVRALATQAWTAIEATSVAPDTPGLQLSAIVAAKALDLITPAKATSLASAVLASSVPPPSDSNLGEYAAGLVTVRQAMPELAPQATQRLAAINWSKIALTSDKLGSRDRLVVFFQVASGARAPAAWSALERLPERLNGVYILSPTNARDQLIPGLWLDEHAIITGASASQLAYTLARQPADADGSHPHGVLETALLLEHFPTVAGRNLPTDPLPVRWLEDAPLADKAALLITTANLLKPESIRNYFQQDPLVRAGRAAITEFTTEDFGAKTSVLWRRELAGQIQVPPTREALAMRAEVARDQWNWVEMSGVDYKDSDADIRPGDPLLSMRFAFTWDEHELFFHAEIVDELPKIATASARDGVELFVNPKNDGLVWGGHDNFQFSYKPTGAAVEWFHNQPAVAQVVQTAKGYTIEARIPWSQLRVEPHAGLEVSISPAVLSEGVVEWQPSLKLNWRYYRRTDERYGLGTLHLE